MEACIGLDSTSGIASGSVLTVGRAGRSKRLQVPLFNRPCSLIRRTRSRPGSARLRTRAAAAARLLASPWPGDPGGRSRRRRHHRADRRRSGLSDRARGGRDSATRGRRGLGAGLAASMVAGTLRAAAVRSRVATARSLVGRPCRGRADRRRLLGHHGPCRRRRAAVVAHGRACVARRTRRDPRLGRPAGRADDERASGCGAADDRAPAARAAAGGLRLGHDGLARFRRAGAAGTARPAAIRCRGRHWTRGRPLGAAASGDIADCSDPTGAGRSDRGADPPRSFANPVASSKSTHQRMDPPEAIGRAQAARLVSEDGGVSFRSRIQVPMNPAEWVRTAPARSENGFGLHPSV
jgi:hypothetical protein